MKSWGDKYSVSVFTLLVLYLIFFSGSHADNVIEVLPASMERDCYRNGSNSSLEGCQMLDMVMQGMQSNTSIRLLPGKHIVQSHYIISSKTDVNITGDLNDPSRVIIECNDSYGLIFMDIWRLSFTGLTVQNCGFNEFNQVNSLFTSIKSFIDYFYSPLFDFSAGLILVDCKDLVIENVNIQENEGFGMFGMNILGNSRFSEVNFVSNFPKTCQLEVTQQPGGSGGGLFLLYQDYTDHLKNSESENSTLIFEYGHIDNNYNCRISPFTTQYNQLSRSLEPSYSQNNSIVGAGGITVVIGQTAFNIDATFEECTFKRNTGLYHSAALDVVHHLLAANSDVYIQNCTFDRNGGLLYNHGSSRNTLDPFGAVLLAFFAPNPIADFISALSLQDVNAVHIANCSFVNNFATSGAGLSVLSFGSASQFVNDRLLLQNCLFRNNTGNYGSAIFVTELSYSAFESGLRVIIDSIYAEGNKAIVRADPVIQSFQADVTSVIDVSNMKVSFVGNNTIIRNSQTAMSVYSTILKFSDHILFSENTGINGGALHLESESYIVLVNKTEVVFDRNVGLRTGGALFVDFGTVRVSTYDCFIFLEEIDVYCDVTDTCPLPGNRYILKFFNNDAPFGRAVFGSNLFTCPWNVDGDRINMVTLNDIPNYPDFSNLDPLKLPVLFEPFLPDDETVVNTRALFIATTPNDRLRYPISSAVTVAPGQMFIMTLAGFDRLGQSVPVTVFSQIRDGLPGLRGINKTIPYSTIGASNSFLLSGGQLAFSNAPVRVFGAENTTHTVYITTSETPLQAEFTLFVTLKNCSVGFRYDQDNQSCVCDIDQFLDGVQCNTDGSISYPAGNWIGFDEEGDYVLAPCILDYCKLGISTIHLSDPDVQCRNNRAGLLCGGCADGYSRIFGSTTCDRCDDNSYLALIIVLAAFGILLFVILALFDITITDGFINGFIFYANIFNVYTSIFLPVTSNRGIPPKVLISFLNLNFGIQSCFYQGMTEIDLAGLTLIFPVYLMFILLSFILFGKLVRNEIVSNFCGKINLMHVFATLLLYSYANMMESCIGILSLLLVDHGQVYPSVRWILDPNIMYASGLHLFLVILCCVFVVILLPLPIILLVPKISFRVRYVRDLKPLIDAFIAPFAPEKAIWVSLRLVFRVVIFLIAAQGVTIEQLVAMSCLITSLSLLQAYVKPYKTTSRNVVDMLLMFNLSLFSIVSVFLFTKHNSDEERVMDVIFVSSYIFLIMLLALFAHYVLIRFECSRKPYEMVITWIIDKLKTAPGYLTHPNRCCIKNEKRDSSSEFEMDDPANEFTHTSVSLSQREEYFRTLRESLLDDNPLPVQPSSSGDKYSQKSTEKSTSY